jgi:DNA-binding XRE family transcriptional regulator
MAKCCVEVLRVQISMTYLTPEQFVECRTVLKLTQKQLAAALGCSKSTIERCEKHGCDKITAMAINWLFYILEKDC